MFRAILELSRISNLPTAWTNVIAAWIIANGRWEWRIELLWLLIGASLMYSAGMILNDVCDVAWDRDHRPERPIPSGQISFRTALGLSIGGLVGGYALMVFAGGAGKGITAALLGAIVLYDVYHKPWAGSVIVMGACRTLLYLAAGSAAAGSYDLWRWSPLMEGGLVLGFYIIGISLTARSEAKGALSLGGRLAVQSLLYAPAASVLWRYYLFHYRQGPTPFGVLVLAPYVMFVFHVCKLMRQGVASIGDAVGWLLAGIVAVDALAAAPFAHGWEFWPLILVPLLRLWQRWIAAT